MLTKFIALMALVISVKAAATPISTKADIDFLNFALSLEYLEAEFFNQLSSPTQEEIALDYPGLDSASLLDVRQGVAGAISNLQNTLGSSADQPRPCSIPELDPMSYAAYLSAFTSAENVISGLAAEHDVGNFLSQLASLTGLISAQANNPLASAPPGAIFNVFAPLFEDGNSPFTDATFIQALPQLNMVTNPAGPNGTVVTLSVVPNQAGSGDSNLPQYLNLLSTTGIVNVIKVGRNGEVRIPANFKPGNYFASMTTDGKPMQDDNTLAGIAIFEMPSSG